MTAPVVRDVDVVTQARSVVTASTPAVVETGTATLNGTPVTVLSSSTTTGAALPGAVAAAGASSVVLLSGTFNTTGTTVLQTGQTLLGAGTFSVSTPSGRTATLTTPGATISSTTVTTSIIEASNSSTLRGLTVTSSLNSGGFSNAVVINGNGVTITGNNLAASQGGSGNSFGIHFQVSANNTTINGNVISAQSTGGGAVVGISVPSATNLSLQGNTVTATGTVAFGASIGIGGPTSVLVSGNTLGASGGATPTLIQIAQTTISAGSAGNVAAGGESAATWRRTPAQSVLRTARVARRRAAATIPAPASPRA